MSIKDGNICKIFFRFWLRVERDKWEVYGFFLFLSIIICFFIFLKFCIILSNGEVLVIKINKNRS